MLHCRKNLSAHKKPKMDSSLSLWYSTQTRWRCSLTMCFKHMEDWGAFTWNVNSCGNEKNHDGSNPFSRGQLWKHHCLSAASRQCTLFANDQYASFGYPKQRFHNKKSSRTHDFNKCQSQSFLDKALLQRLTRKRPCSNRIYLRTARLGLTR